MKVAMVAQMRNLDRTAIEKYGISGPILMENAGEAAYYLIAAETGGVAGLHFVVLCGGGHNGGDGLVVARKLHSMGAQVEVFCLGKPEKFDDTVRPFYEMVTKIGIPVTIVPDESILPAIAQALADADGIVDALFGTGLSREVGGRYARVIAMINESPALVFSIDIPSGIHGDTGQMMGVAVRADATITFGLPKPGNLIYPGFEYGGALTVTHISFPPALYEKDDLKIAVSPFPPMPERRGDAHKGSVGKVMFVAGASRYLGAPYFASMAFLRAGGGLAYLATPETVAPFIAMKGNEIVLMPRRATPAGSLSLDNLDDLLADSEEMAMVSLGSGMSLEPETQELARALAVQLDKPLLIDGDGLSALADDPAILLRRTAPTILTPHPGEMARLMGVPVSEVQANRIQAALRGAQEWGVTIVLKGAHTLIAHPDGRVYFNLSGNAGMATAGSGDVLTGVIAGMYAALHYDFETAARMGAFIHGVAGDLAADELGEEGVVAGDILARVPEAIGFYREYHQAIADTSYGKIAVI
jgi:NAD(P)H-hydrate epimerase